MKNKIIFFFVFILLYRTIPFLYYLSTRYSRKLIISSRTEPLLPGSKTIRVATYNIARGRDGILRHDEKSQFTFPAWKPDRTIDFILVNKSGTFVDYKTMSWLFSDHLPVISTIKF